MENNLEESLLRNGQHDETTTAGGQTWGRESTRPAEQLRVQASDVDISVDVPRVNGRTVQVTDLQEGGSLSRAIEQQAEEDGKHQCAVRVNAALEMESESTCVLYDD